MHVGKTTCMYNGSDNFVVRTCDGALSLWPYTRPAVCVDRPPLPCCARAAGDKPRGTMWTVTCPDVRFDFDGSELKVRTALACPAACMHACACAYVPVCVRVEAASCM